MKISKDRATKLYSSISRVITDLRVAHLKGNVDDLDFCLFKLEQEISANVEKALNITVETKTY